MTDSHVELYVLELREQWSRCGPGILKLCAPYREALERQARLVVQDLQDWVVRVESSLPRRLAKRRAFADWSARWQGKLAELKSDPLALPPGDTLGVNPSSSLLSKFRWWCLPMEAQTGPLNDLVNSVLKDVGSLPSRLLDAMRSFPESVVELHHLMAKSPWAAAYLLNWLLSNKGVLRPSRRSPIFDGASAVPDSRAWMDHLMPTFEDWLVSRFEVKEIRKPRIRYDSGKLVPDNNSFVSPSGEAALSQIQQPVLPSAYIVATGADALDVRKVHRGATSLLRAPEGQCCVFEFLVSRLEQLEQRQFGVEEELAGPPALVVVDGEGRRPVALQIGTSTALRPLTLGAANLLWVLGKYGHAVGVLYQNITELRRSLGKLQSFLDVGKKIGKRTSKNYARCDAPKLQGQVDWIATKENSPAI